MKNFWFLSSAGDSETNGKPGQSANATADKRLRCNKYAIVHNARPSPYHKFLSVCLFSFKARRIESNENNFPVCYRSEKKAAVVDKAIKKFQVFLVTVSIVTLQYKSARCSSMLWNAHPCTFPWNFFLSAIAKWKEIRRKKSCGDIVVDSFW